MSISELFESVGAPLRNFRWSWGAVRMMDGAVFLRVWQDEIRRRGNREYMRITANEYFQNHDPNNLGYRERLNQLGLIRNGARSYMIICVARNVDAIPRAIRNYNREYLYLGGRLMEADGDSWLEITGRVPVQEVSLPD